MLFRSLAIAEELKIGLHRNRRAQGTRHTVKPGKTGHDIAVEQESSTPAEGADHAPADARLEVEEQRETVRRIKALHEAGKTPQQKAKNQEIAKSLARGFDNGELTDDQVRKEIRKLIGDV